MKRCIAIILGEPNSISSEIIFKAWKDKRKYKHKPFFIIGNKNLLEKQKQKLRFKLKIKEISKNFTRKELFGNYLPVYDVKYNQTKPFQKISKKSNKFIFSCFNVCLDFLKEKKIEGFINCPISKENLFKKNYQGVTEYISKKINKKNNEVMLIYNSNLSVVPITTHIPLRKVANLIKKKLIIKKMEIFNNFYKKKLNKKIKIGILGLNPHNYSDNNYSEEEKIIIPAIKFLKNKKINVIGPISPDTSFVYYKNKKIDILIGMYHDQVLTGMKSIFKFNAINITLGLPFIRISPDHGVGEDIMGKKIANHQSLIESIKFFNLIK